MEEAAGAQVRTGRGIAGRGGGRDTHRADRGPRAARGGTHAKQSATARAGDAQGSACNNHTHTQPRPAAATDRHAGIHHPPDPPNPPCAHTRARNPNSERAAAAPDARPARRRRCSGGAVATSPRPPRAPSLLKDWREAGAAGGPSPRLATPAPASPQPAHPPTERRRAALAGTCTAADGGQPPRYETRAPAHPPPARRPAARGRAAPAGVSTETKGSTPPACARTNRARMLAAGAPLGGASAGGASGHARGG